MDVRILTAADAPLLERVADEVFDEPVDPGLTAEFLTDPRHRLCVAVEAGEVVGFASAVRYVHPDKPSELWINEVGVSPAHQRRGVARAVMACLFDHARAEGCREAWVLTEPDNAPARALYAAVGGTETPAVMVSFRLQD